jgi:flagellar assembly protein FliH
VRLHEARWTANAEENVAALAIAVARHIVGREVSADPETVRALVRRALVGMPLDSAIVVRLHPDDLAACAGLVVPEVAGRTPDIRWTADPHIMRGGCLIEGRERIIDGRIDTSLERAYRSIGNIQA